ERLVGQPDVLSVDLAGFLACEHLHPDDRLLPAVGLLHRRVDDLDHHRRDVDSGAIPFDERDDRVVWDTEREILVDRDLRAAGRDLDVLVRHEELREGGASGNADYIRRRYAGSRRRSKDLSTSQMAATSAITADPPRSSIRR